MVSWEKRKSFYVDILNPWWCFCFPPVYLFCIEKGFILEKECLLSKVQFKLSDLHVFELLFLTFYFVGLLQISEICDYLWDHLNRFCLFYLGDFH